MFVIDNVRQGKQGLIILQGLLFAIDNATQEEMLRTRSGCSASHVSQSSASGASSSDPGNGHARVAVRDLNMPRMLLLRNSDDA